MAGRKKAKAKAAPKAATKTASAPATADEAPVFGDKREYYEGKYQTHSPVTGLPRKTPLSGAK